MSEERLVEGLDGQLVPRTVAARDEYVVCREPLAEVVQGFISDWNRDHEPDKGRFAGGERKVVTQVRAVQWLAAETRRRDPTDVGIPEKAILNMFRRTPEGRMRYHTIDYGIADALVSAIGRPDVLHTDGRLQPHPRSNASCCSGSLSGVVPPPPGFY